MAHHHPAPLAEGLASLRGQVGSILATRWIPDAIHTLILALVLRLIGRLEDMYTLWAAGHPIPIPAPRTRTPVTTHPDSASRPASAWREAARPRRASRPDSACPAPRPGALAAPSRPRPPGDAALFMRPSPPICRRARVPVRAKFQNDPPARHRSTP